MADIFDEIARMRAAGAAFCIATVVRTADATSAKAGARALVAGDGTITGHLGGGCIRRAVASAAREALAVDAVRLIRVAPSGNVTAMTHADGATPYASGCPSGGTVELLIEPHRPAPRLVVFGLTPVAAAILAQGRLLGLRAVSAAGAGLAAEGEAVFDAAGLGPLGLGPRDAVVVASQGEGDLAAAAAALESPAGFVSMVASARKAAVLRQRLAARGVPEDRLGALRSPAGLPMAAIDPAEIALSVVAEIVAWRRGGQADAAPATGTAG